MATWRTTEEGIKHIKQAILKIQESDKPKLNTLTNTEWWLQRLNGISNDVDITDTTWYRFRSGKECLRSDAYEICCQAINCEPQKVGEVCKRRFSKSKSTGSQFECTVFKSNSDIAFEPALIKAIEQAKEQIVFIGWGLAFIANQNRKLTDLLIAQLCKQPKLNICIFLVDSKHRELKLRIEEEAKAQAGYYIHSQWSTEFFSFLQKELNNKALGGEILNRCKVKRIPYLSHSMILKLDNLCFFSPYGAPDRGGWATPWLFIQDEENPHITKFLMDEVNFALRNYQE
jgi:hypothetical protein